MRSIAPSTRVPAGRVLRPTVIALAVTACASPTLAQTPGASSGAVQLDTVVVTGQRGSLRKSVVAQEKADNVVSVLSADDIGALPDKNAAEALARLPGVSVQRDQGEGRYVVVRGIGPDLNAVTINGALVPAPEGGRRGVALDVLPAGMISTLTVTKTLRPDQDANSIGGTIDVETLSAFDLPKSIVSVNAGLTDDENTGMQSWGGGGLVAHRFLGGRLGVVGAISVEERRFGSDNVETGGAWNAANRLTGFELRDYRPVRDRNALALNLDFRPGEAQKYFLRSFYSSFSDDEVRDRITISNISAPNPAPPPATVSTAADGQPFTARAERRVRQRKYTQEIESYLAGTEQRFGAWTLDVRGGLTKASEDTPESLNDGRFRNNANFTGLSFSGTSVPRLNAPAGLYDPANYSLNAIVLQQRLSKDEEKHLRFDLTRKLALDGRDAEVKFGAKTSRREKTNDTNQWAYNSNSATSPNYWGPGSLSMTGFTQGPVDYQLGNFGPGLDPSAIRARVGTLPRDAARLAAESAINDWTMKENIDAAYLMGSTDWGALTLMAGVRMERTDFDASGFRVQGASITPRTAGQSYTDWLPNLQARWRLNPNLSMRGAVTQSVVRANFSQLAPGITLASSTEATIGNPDLKPLKSTNLDLGVEYILGNDGALSAYLFSKDIKNFTYTTNLAGTPPWTAYTTATSFANGDSARVNGLELSYQQVLRMLPAPFNGLIVGANVTLTDSKAKLARFDVPSGGFRSRDIPLPGASDLVYNLVLGYEAGRISTRVAANYKSKYLLETGGDILNGQQDRYVDAQTQLDFSLAVRLTRGVQLVFEGINLNNEKYYVFQGSQPYNTQYEQYGRTYKLSIRADLY